MNEEEFAELAAGYALNALSPDARRRFEEALAAHPEWSAVVDADIRTASSLAEAVPEVLPPLTMRSSLLSRIATLPQGETSRRAVHDADAEPFDDVAPAVEASALPDPGTEDAAEPARPPVPPKPPMIEPAPTTTTIQAISRRNWTRSLLALAASLVLLVSLGFGASMIGDWLNRTPEQIALADVQAAPDARSATAEFVDGGGTATAYWSESLGTAVLVTNGLPEITDDETYEMWFVGTDGTPVSAGTFAAEDGRATEILDGEVTPGDTIAISIEPAGGSTEGVPTTEPIVLVPTA